MGYAVAIGVIVCAVIAWFRSRGRAGGPGSWRRQLSAMGAGLVLVPVALIGLWLFGLNLLTFGLALVCGAALVLRGGGRAASGRG